MHGLMNRAIQCFVRDTYGAEAWLDVARAARLGFTSFEAMLTYDDALTFRVLDALTEKIGLPQDALLEDMGTYLVSHPNTESLRRLMRFGGVTFIDFLHSLDDMHDRARLAVPDIDLPRLELRLHTADSFTLLVCSPIRGFGPVMVGILRAMADDYGVLGMVDYRGRSQGVDTIQIQVAMAEYAEGRRFDLAQRATG